MRRLFWLIILSLFMISAAVADGLQVHVPKECRCYSENEIMISTDHDTVAVLRITDSMGNNWRTIRQELTAGMNVLLWDGLGEFEEKLEYVPYTLTVEADGETASASFEVTSSETALQLALPSSETLYNDKYWFVQIKCVRRATVVQQVALADSPDEIVYSRKFSVYSDGVHRVKWTGAGLPAGNYILTFYSKDAPDYKKSFPLTIDSGNAPVYTVGATGSIMPETMDDDEIWSKMMMPSVVVDIDAEETQKIYAGPSTKCDSLGTVHGQSQALQVNSISGDWANVSAWNHESGSYIRGFVPVSVLRVQEANTRYGILINKQDQTLTVYERGTPIYTIPISTGLMRTDYLKYETSAGSYLTLEHMISFQSGRYRFLYPIRYDGGNLIHQVGFLAGDPPYDFSDLMPMLGQKASHGCVRIPGAASQEWISAWWLYTHIPTSTRVIVLDDYEQRQARAAQLGVTVTDMDDKPLYTAVFPKDQPSQDSWLVVDEDAEQWTEDSRTVVLTIGGDAVLGTRENWQRNKNAFPAYIQKNGMSWPFSGLSEYFSTDDMTMINLQGVLKDDKRGENGQKQYRFRGLTSYTQILTTGSVEQVNIANNHYIDYGADGRKSTIKALDDAGILYSGYGTTAIVDIKGHRIGFAGCRETIYLQNPEIVKQECDELRNKGCEVIIYTCHWGTEYSYLHNKTQEEMAKAVIAAGADIVIGGHPHVVEGLDVINGIPVLWSLGNLSFGGTIDLTTYDAMLARLQLSFNDQGYSGVTINLIPIQTSGRSQENVNDYRPVPANREQANRIFEMVQCDSSITIADDMWFEAVIR